MDSKSQAPPKMDEMIQRINENEKKVTEKNAVLTKVSQYQQELIERQRQLLKDVAQTNAELLAIEQKRAELKSKLSSQKTALLVAASEAQETSSIIRSVLENAPDTPMSSTKSGQMTLKIVDAISQSISQLTESCIESQNLSIDSSKLQGTIADVNNLIQKVMDAGLAQESSEDTIRRQSYLISALVQTKDQE